MSKRSHRTARRRALSARMGKRWNGRGKLNRLETPWYILRRMRARMVMADDEHAGVPAYSA